MFTTVIYNSVYLRIVNNCNLQLNLFQDGNFDFSSLVNDTRNVTCLTFIDSGDVVTGDDLGRAFD
jgi:hypothetical protein